MAFKCYLFEGGGGTEKTLLFGTSLKEYSLINTF
jgi:hypothetical protein